MSASSAKKRKRANASGHKDGDVLPSLKVPKNGNPRPGDEDNRQSRTSNRESEEAENIEPNARKATPATVERWKASLAQAETRLTKVQSKYKYATGEKAKKASQHEQLEPRRIILRYTKLLQKYHELHKTEITAEVDAGSNDDKTYGDTSDKGNSSEESESNSSNGSGDVEKNNSSNPRIRQPLKPPTMSQPAVQHARQGRKVPPAGPKSSEQVKHTKVSAKPVTSRVPASPTIPYSLDFVQIPDTSLGCIIGRNWERLQQIERETNTRIDIAPRDEDSPREFRIQGTPQAIAKVKTIFDKLLNYRQGRAEERRLDDEVETQKLLYPMGIPRNQLPHQFQARFQKPSSAAKVVSHWVHPVSVSFAQPNASPSSVPGPFHLHRNGLDDGLVRPRASALDSSSLRKRLDEISNLGFDSSSSSSSSSNDELPASSPIPPQVLARSRRLSTSPKSADDEPANRRQSQAPRIRAALSIPTGASSLAHRPRATEMELPSSAPLARPPLPQLARASTPFQVPAGSALVKIEDDSDEEKQPPPRPQTPPALRRAYDLGIVPINNMVTLAEFEDILSMKETEKGKLEYRIKVLEYALHFKGVSDPQIMRLMSRSGTVDGKRSWDPKFEGILGHARQGRVTDGRPLQRQNR